MPKHGQICWTEIASDNIEKAVGFYHELFGWEIQPGGNPEMDYREFDDGSGHHVGGIYQINPDFFGGNPPPPHMLSYISVDNVDQSAEKADELGGKTLRGPLDIPGVGRMAVVQDPSGAMFALITLSGGHDHA